VPAPSVTHLAVPTLDNGHHFGAGAIRRSSSKKFITNIRIV